ncbi:MAG: hypothetical protein JNJ49_04315 [Bdellovibrionaceae bacterium]|nr:hypothetical protein [Pseudobdellovibrionaceae bacterium]
MKTTALRQFAVTFTLAVSLLTSAKAWTAEIESDQIAEVNQLTLDDLIGLSEDEIQNSVIDENLAYYPPRPGRGRGVQCKAENERYVVFYGRGPNLPAARDAALQRCYSVSRRCYMMGCTEIR